MEQKGFTLIELLVTVAIVAILASIALPAFKEYKEAAYDSEADQTLKNAVTAINTFLGDEEDEKDHTNGLAFSRPSTGLGKAGGMYDFNEMLPGFRYDRENMLVTAQARLDCGTEEGCEYIHIDVIHCQGSRYSNGRHKVRSYQVHYQGGRYVTTKRIREAGSPSSLASLCTYDASAF